MNSKCNYTCIEIAEEVCIDCKSSTSSSKHLRLFRFSSIVLSLCFVLFSIVTAQGQTDFYNEKFEKLTNLEEIKSFVADMKVNSNADRYRINKTPVVEYYDKNDNSFKGLCIDVSLRDFDKINIVKKDKSLKRFIKIHGLQLGSALYFKRPFEGMTLGHLKLIIGEPDQIRYAIEGQSQVIHLKYNDGRIFSFKEGKLMKQIQPSSKTPIALEQP